VRSSLATASPFQDWRQSKAVAIERNPFNMVRIQRDLLLLLFGFDLFHFRN
jgi:hypothetical protein